MILKRETWSLKINVPTGFFLYLCLASEQTRTEFFQGFQLIYSSFFGEVLIAFFLLTWQNAEYLVTTKKKGKDSFPMTFVLLMLFI